MRRVILPFNPTTDGVAYAIVSRYEGRAYLQYMDGGRKFPATGVIEIWE